MEEPLKTWFEGRLKTENDAGEESCELHGSTDHEDARMRIAKTATTRADSARERNTIVF